VWQPGFHYAIVPINKSIDGGAVSEEMPFQRRKNFVSKQQSEIYQIFHLGGNDKS